MTDSAPVSDDQIVDALLKGERQGVVLLLERYGRLIVAIAMSKHGLPLEDAEELRNDVILEIERRIESFDGTKGTFRSWIMRIAKCRAIDRYRKNKKNQTEYTMPEEWWATIGHDDHLPAESDSNKIDQPLRIRIENALSQLNDRDKELLRLRAEGHSPDDIAHLLGIEKNAATVAYHRA